MLRVPRAGGLSGLSGAAVARANLSEASLPEDGLEPNWVEEESLAEPRASVESSQLRTDTEEPQRDKTL